RRQASPQVPSRQRQQLRLAGKDATRRQKPLAILLASREDDRSTRPDLRESQASRREFPKIMAYSEVKRKLPISCVRPMKGKKRKSCNSSNSNNSFDFVEAFGGAGSSACSRRTCRRSQTTRPQELRTAAERLVSLQLQQSRSSQQISRFDCQFAFVRTFLSASTFYRCVAMPRLMAPGNAARLWPWPRLWSLDCRSERRRNWAARLVSLRSRIGNAENLLVDLCMSEVNNQQRRRPPQRRRYFAETASQRRLLEFFLRLTCQTYLKSVLTEPLSVLLTPTPALSYEVDPQRALSADQLASGQRNLLSLVELFWLRDSRLRAELSAAGGCAAVRSDAASGTGEASTEQLGDTSGRRQPLPAPHSCPGDLGPSLFGLCDAAARRPEQVARSRWLPRLYRTLPTVAAGGNREASMPEAPFGSKEPHLQFLNGFLERNFATRC
uniref:Ras-GAP domain-containing protein n=1 Tax=Macrostomum lignano TaxID=282301 RepID=A0A1I8FQ34_9PLAT